jgi:hypothetical protein
MGGIGLPILRTTDRSFPGKGKGSSYSMATTGEAAPRGAALLASERPGRLAKFPLGAKITTSLGQTRFDTAHGEKSDHSDRWWAFCPAAVAGTAAARLLAFWRKQAQAHAIKSRGRCKVPRQLGPTQSKLRDGNRQAEHEFSWLIAPQMRSTRFFNGVVPK